MKCGGLRVKSARNALFEERNNFSADWSDLLSTFQGRGIKIVYVTRWKLRGTAIWTILIENAIRANKLFITWKYDTLYLVEICKVIYNEQHNKWKKW